MFLGLPLRRAELSPPAEETDKAANIVIISDDFRADALDSRRDVLDGADRDRCEHHDDHRRDPKRCRRPYRAEFIAAACALSPTMQRRSTTRILSMAFWRDYVFASRQRTEGAVSRMCAAIRCATIQIPRTRARVPSARTRESLVMDFQRRILVIVGAAVLCAADRGGELRGSAARPRDGRRQNLLARCATGRAGDDLSAATWSRRFCCALAGPRSFCSSRSGSRDALHARPGRRGRDGRHDAPIELYAARLDLPLLAFAAGVMTLVGLGFRCSRAVRRSTNRSAQCDGALRHAAQALDRGAREITGSFVVDRARDCRHTPDSEF